MVLDDNASHEAFQFWWYALTLAPTRPGTPPSRLETEERLRQKLVAVSKPNAGGGRELREPCELKLAPEERLALLDRIEEMMHGGWLPAAVPHAEAARLLLVS